MSELSEGLLDCRLWVAKESNRSMTEHGGKFVGDDLKHIVLHVNEGVTHHYRINLDQMSSSKVRGATRWLEVMSSKDKATPTETKAYA